MADKNEIYKDRRDVQAQINDGLKEQNNLTNAFSKVLQAQLNTSEELTKSIKDRAKTLDTMIQSGNKDLSLDTRLTKLKSRQAEIDEKLSKSRGKAGRFQKGFNAQIVKSLNVDRETLDTEIKKLSIQEGIKTVTEKVKGTLMSQVVQGGLLVTIFMGLKKLVFAFAAKIDTLGKSFGVAGVSSGALQTNLFDSSENMTKLGAGLEEAISITNILSSDFGFSADESARLADNIFDSSVAMGLSADEGAKLFGILMSMGNMTQGQAENLAESTYQLAQANKVAPQAVMKDIADNADIFAKNMKDGGKNVLEAAVQAKKLGLSLSDVDSIAGGLVDFQSSLNAEIEASIMLGRDVNLQKARELALDNDLTEMMNEVVKQAGGEAEFSKLNRLEREAISKAIGVSVSQMAKLVGETGKLEAPKSFADIAGDKAMSNLTAIIQEFKSFGATLLNEVGPIFEKTFGKFHDFIKSGDGISTMKEYALGFIDTLVSLPSIIKKIISMMIIWKGISLGVALANAAAMVFAQGVVTLGVGLAAGVVAAGATLMAIKSLPTFQDLPPGTQVTPTAGSAAMAHGKGQHGAETILHTNDIVDAVEALGTKLDSYFGINGSTPNKIGSAVARNITTAIK